MWFNHSHLWSMRGAEWGPPRLWSEYHGWCSQTLVGGSSFPVTLRGDTGWRYLMLALPVVWIFKFNGEWVLLAALHLCKSFVMWLREDNCMLNILFVLQLVLTRWPPTYDPVFRCTVCTVQWQRTLIVQCMGPVPQSATDDQPVQISADISAKRSTTSLWGFQDDFNNKENSDIDTWLSWSKCWLCLVICSEESTEVAGNVK